MDGILSYDVTCPRCDSTIHLPFFGELEAKSVAEYDLLETEAQEELSMLRSWLGYASMWDLIKYRLARR